MHTYLILKDPVLMLNMHVRRYALCMHVCTYNVIYIACIIYGKTFKGEL